MFLFLALCPGFCVARKLFSFVLFAVFNAENQDRVALAVVLAALIFVNHHFTGHIIHLNLKEHLQPFKKVIGTDGAEEKYCDLGFSSTF